MKKLKITLIVLIASVGVFAQNSNRNFEMLTEHDNYIEVKVNDGTYNIQFYTSNIVETTFIPEGEQNNEASHAVVLLPEEVGTTLDEAKNSSEYTSGDLTVHIQHQPFQISYNYQNTPIISEKKGYHKLENGEAIEFNLTNDEVLYGGGARALGMNRRGNRLQLYNRAHYGYETHSELMNYTMPIVLSSNNYLLHFDNAPIGYLDLDSQQNNALTYETISGRKTYQIVVGDSWLDIMDNYTKLTGKQPLPPRWALGNFSSRFGYHSQQETEETIAKYKSENIPVDAVVLDLYWFGKEIQGSMGNFEVYKDSFPDFEGMVSNFKNQGVNTVVITEPFVLTTSNKWEEAVVADVLAKDSIGQPYTYDFYFGNTGLIDIYNPKGKKWFKDIYKEIAALGVTGVWGDLGEPEVHPEDLLHHQYTANEVHNIYGHHWAELVYEASKEFDPESRPFILMRAGYSGSQRFGLIPWSGDVNRTWGGLQSQPEIALQMGMQGLGYMHSDLGGFAGANLDDELYVRWLQYGVFQPVYRPHAQEQVASEPVFRSEKAKTLAKKAIELRYQLLPYNYTIAFENNQTGAPLMRPLFFEEDKETYYTTASTYLWGNDFLISPVVEAGATEVQVEFPKTNNWTNFYTDEIVEGDQTITVKTEEEHIPTYVRNGAFILMTPVVHSTQDYTGTNLELHYYYDVSIQESERNYYNDDGTTADAYAKGHYEILEFEAEQERKWLEMDFEATLGENWISETKQIQLAIHHIDWQPKRVKVNGKKVDFELGNNVLRLPIVWDTKNELELKIKR